MASDRRTFSVSYEVKRGSLVRVNGMIQQQLFLFTSSCSGWVIEASSLAVPAAGGVRRALPSAVLPRSTAGGAWRAAAGGGRRGSRRSRRGAERPHARRALPRERARQRRGRRRLLGGRHAARR